ncbi:MAG: chromate efflux transporter [Alphaproteobacteria bacterium]|nr:chromate efflux transporter [Alphaproteobacteria bacterium]
MSDAMPDAGRLDTGALRPSFREALRFWLKLGCISFGGPAGQIAIMQSELVDRRKWIGPDAFLRGLNFCTLLPGPEAQQLATYVGWRLHGTKGGIAAGALFVLPGALLLLLLSWIAAAGSKVPAVAAAFNGLKPVVIAIVLHAVWRIGKRALKSWHAVAVAAAAFLALFGLGIDFPWIVAAAALIGWLSVRDGASPFAVGGHGDGPASDAPLFAHKPEFGPRMVRCFGVYLLLLLAGGALVLWGFGAKPFLDIATLFTKAAFVTFGGAYAVLPYVAEEAVREYNWLSPAQMLDGLALAETTPGPLILVLQYVGFFAAWNAIPGDGQLAAAIAASALTTWCTFLPSFAMVLTAAPFIEGLHQNRRIGAALGAITAAVVGVILNLAVFLAGAVLVPSGRPDLVAIAVAALALIALIRFSPPIHWLVAAGIVFGLARMAIGGV